MTDHDLEQRLRAAYREMAEPASAVLRSTVEAVPDVASQDRRTPQMSRFGLFALAAAAVAVTLAIGIGTLVRPLPDIGTQEITTPSERPSPAPTVSEPAPEGSVHAWPGVRDARAGRYFWDMVEARWMHHGGMSIRMGYFADPAGDDPVATTVAGYPATVTEQRDDLGVQSRTWIVEIDGSRVFIIAYHGVLNPDGGALGTAKLEELESIVASIRREPDPDGTGFRLTFTLPEGWSSG